MGEREREKQSDRKLVGEREKYEERQGGKREGARERRNERMRYTVYSTTWEKPEQSYFS